MRHVHLVFAARADHHEHAHRAEPRRHLLPDPSIACHQRRFAHQRPLFHPHHRRQRALRRQPRIFSQKGFVLFRANDLRRMRQLFVRHVAARQHRAAWRNPRQHRFPRQRPLSRNQFILPKALRPRQHHRLHGRHFHIFFPLDVQRLPARLLGGRQRPAHSFVPAKGNQPHAHPSRRWYAALRRFMAKNKNCRTSLKLNSNVTFQSFIPASTCSAGSGSRRPRFRSCRTGRCAWASPARVPASCKPCSSHG